MPQVIHIVVPPLAWIQGSGKVFFAEVLCRDRPREFCGSLDDVNDSFLSSEDMNESFTSSQRRPPRTPAGGPELPDPVL